jgi:hypothetical protein
VRTAKSIKKCSGCGTCILTLPTRSSGSMYNAATSTLRSHTRGEVGS